MQHLLRSLPKSRRCHLSDHHRGFVDFASVKHLKDRGLDHAVQRENHLKPMLNIKNLIKSEPSKSLPLSVITQNKDTLKIPMRPIEFIRKYPSIFQEISPGGITVHPHIKLTQQVLDLDAEEKLVYNSDSYKQIVADRVLKLLMISRIDKISVKLLDDLVFDLGLPQDYVSVLVPDFPDCFRVIRDKNFGSDSGLELVCWSDDLAVSCVEKKAKNGENEFKKGLPLSFSMQFSKGFEMDKQLKKWFDNWQKLPYVSPYENAAHLGSTTDESDKWTVGVLHELLNLFVSKKVERDTLLCLGEWLGIRSRFKRALFHHPGIFYLSSKMGTCTVVLKEGYKRGLLIEKCPMANIRSRYAHLMNTVVEDRKVGVPGGSKKQEKKLAEESKEQGKTDDNENTSEVNNMNSDLEDDDDYEWDDDEVEEGDRRTRGRSNAPTNRSWVTKKKNFDVKRRSRDVRRQTLIQKHRGETKDGAPPKIPDRMEVRKGHKFKFSQPPGERLRSLKTKGNLFTGKPTAT